MCTDGKPFGVDDPVFADFCQEMIIEASRVGLTVLPVNDLYESCTLRSEKDWHFSNTPINRKLVGDHVADSLKMSTNR